MIKSRSSTAYETIAQELSQEISSGTYRPGEPLPSSSELCQRFGVAPMTLRNALRLLEGHGLLALRQGRAPLVLARGDEAGSKREQVAKRLHADIIGGTYAAGSTLPSEQELMQKHSASRDTVRAALKDLEALGVVVRRRGLRRQVAGATGEADLAYLRTAARIREDIESGTYRLGAVLPGAETLGRTYGVSRPTVSAALDQLERSGVIERTTSGRRRVTEVN
ncbi:GntR family transcriptional regulator [Kitasatospora sp. NPDC005751]|uniref:GntR family transcriptional regulator n=1 Tax=Kitasatospora sp. NPDC005751 TaxID=3157064 RepID=UPI0033D2F982